MDEFRDQYDPTKARARLDRGAAQTDPLRSILDRRETARLAPFSDLPYFVKRRAWDKGIAARIVRGQPVQSTREGMVAYVLRTCGCAPCLQYARERDARQ